MKPGVYELRKGLMAWLVIPESHVFVLVVFDLQEQRRRLARGAVRKNENGTLR